MCGDPIFSSFVLVFFIGSGIIMVEITGGISSSGRKENNMKYYSGAD